MLNYRVSSCCGVHPQPGPLAIEPLRSIRDEVAFLRHRFEILDSWPTSEHRTALIRATLERLQTLGSVSRA